VAALSEISDSPTGAAMSEVILHHLDRSPFGYQLRKVK
jgi:hypothetical protein